MKKERVLPGMAKRQPKCLDIPKEPADAAAEDWRPEAEIVPGLLRKDVRAFFLYVRHIRNAWVGKELQRKRIATFKLKREARLARQA